MVIRLEETSEFRHQGFDVIHIRCKYYHHERQCNKTRRWALVFDLLCPYLIITPGSNLPQAIVILLSRFNSSIYFNDLLNLLSGLMDGLCYNTYNLIKTFQIKFAAFFVVVNMTVFNNIKMYVCLSKKQPSWSTSRLGLWCNCSGSFKLTL